jgi:hypothetical protein
MEAWLSFDFGKWKMSESLKGHNNPPEMLETAPEVAKSISAWMAESPIVQNETDAKAIKMQIDRAKLCIKDLEDERDGKVRPLNDTVASINFKYRSPRRLLGDLLDEMLNRLSTFVKAEERRREQIALEAQAKARAAEAAAREAERIEQEKLDDAARGELGIDAAKVISDADEAFEAFERAERQAILARKEVHVKVGGGLGRAISLRKVETLHITSCAEALEDIGFTDGIKEAILKSAMAYRKLHNRLPRGIFATEEKHL